MAKNQVTLTFAGDTASLDRAFNKVGDGASKTQSKFQKFSRVAKVASLAVVGGIAAIGKIGFDELTGTQKVMAQTEAVLKSTGGVANVTAKDVEKLSLSLMKKSGVDDDVIASGQNMLLTFTKIRNEAGKGNKVFDRATKATLDMSVAMGTDMKSASIQVGKALNDPIKGVSALQRVGVSFTEGQKAQIEAMVKSGDTMGAQKIILKELETQFGGSAEAAGKTLAGQISIARESFKNLSAEIVKAVLPAFMKFTTIALQVIGVLSEHKTTTTVVIAVLGTLAVAVLSVNAAVKVWRATTIAFTAAQWLLNVALSANPIGLVILAIAGLVAGLVIAYKNSETFRRIVTKAFDAVMDAARATWNWIKENWPLLLGILTGPVGLAVVAIVKNWDKIKDGIKAIKTWITDNWATVIGTLAGPVGRAATTIVSKWNSIKGAVDDAIGAIKSIPGAIGSLAKSAALQGIDNVFGTVFGAAKSVVNSVADAIQNVISKAQSAINFVGDLKSKAAGIAKKALPGFANGGIVTGPTTALIGEAGPEVVIPLTRPQRAQELMQQAGLSGVAFGGGAGVHIDTMIVRNNDDVQAISSQLGRHLMMQGV